MTRRNAIQRGKIPRRDATLINIFKDVGFTNILIVAMQIHITGLWRFNMKMKKKNFLH